MAKVAMHLVAEAKGEEPYFPFCLQLFYPKPH